MKKIMLAMVIGSVFLLTTQAKSSCPCYKKMSAKEKLNYNIKTKASLIERLKACSTSKAKKELLLKRIAECEKEIKKLSKNGKSTSIVIGVK